MSLAGMPGSRVKSQDPQPSTPRRLRPTPLSPSGHRRLSSESPAQPRAACGPQQSGIPTRRGLASSPEKTRRA
eukprot:9393782-Alexandrium_andersonii.AAC.1